MQAQEPSFDHLSIADLESMLAEKRRSDSKRVLRAVAGRKPGETVVLPALRPAGLTPSEPVAVALPVLRPAGLTPSEPVEVGGSEAALSAVPTSLLRGQSATPVGGRTTRPGSRAADRFRRSELAGESRTQAPRGPAWMRNATFSKSMDRGLQIAEFGFFLLLLYVVGQWLFADSLTVSDSKLAAEMQPVAVTQRVAGVSGTITKTPAPAVHPTLKPAPTADVKPAPAAPAGPMLPPQKPDLSGGGEPLREDSALSDRDRMIQARLALKGPSDSAVLLGANVPLTGILTDTGTITPTLPLVAVESNPATATEIRIPKISLDARVREVQVQLDTWEWEVADFMAGHHAGTANPGDTGNVVIAGHRDIRGKIFYNLDKLKKGDDIYLYSGRGTYHYVVRKTLEVKPTSIEVMAPTTDARLTLITCTPVRFATRRLIIIADLDTNYTAPSRGR